MPVRREHFLVSAAVALIAPAGLVGSRAAAQTSACGVERWTVKTLQDRPALLPAQSATIAYLVSRPHPSVLPAARLPFEQADVGAEPVCGAAGALHAPNRFSDAGSRQLLAALRRCVA